MLPQETVWIFALRQGHHTDAHANVQEESNAAFRGCPTCGVTIKDQHDLFHDALEQPHMMLRQRRAERPDRMCYALAVAGNDVGIAFHHQRLIALSQRRLG